MLNDGLLVETVSASDSVDGRLPDDRSSVVLKEFEVLPANAGTAVRAVSESDGDKAKLEANLMFRRIKIKGLPENAWRLSVWEQMSVDDYMIMQNAISEFDKNFTFAPPLVRVNHLQENLSPMNHSQV